MLSITWNKVAADNPVKLADCIELTIALDDDCVSDVFGYDDFVDLIRDEPYELSDDGDNQDFLDGDEADEAKVLFESAVALVQQRHQWLGELYPFVGDGNEVRFCPGRDQTIWAPYIYLLACSNHTFVPYGQRKFTTGFEVVSKAAMSALFNEATDIFLFSQFSQDRAQIGLSASEAVIEICEKLHAQIVNQSKIPTDSDEFGIDLMAIDPVGDSLASPFAAFAQCTIGANWESKRHEAQPQNRLNAYVHLTAIYSNLLFIPHLPRVQSGEWDVDLHETINCLLRDRLSICKMLERLRTFNNPTAQQEMATVIDAFYLQCASVRHV